MAYKYVGGLKGFSISDTTRVVWRDTARAWQQYAFGGAVNQDAVGLRARNRLAFWRRTAVRLGFLPPSHKFFFSREIETNLGYVYYRKDGENVIRDRRAAAGSGRWATSRTEFRTKCGTAASANRAAN